MAGKASSSYQIVHGRQGQLQLPTCNTLEAVARAYHFDNFALIQNPFTVEPFRHIFAMSTQTASHMSSTATPTVAPAAAPTVYDPLVRFPLFPYVGSSLTPSVSACVNLLASSVSVSYKCGGFAQELCSPKQYQICVKDCLTHTAPMDKVDGLLQMENYNTTCAGCMGELSFCGARNCTQCAAGAKDSPTCQACNEVKCNPNFLQCSGLNVALFKSPPLDLAPILAGTLGGFAVALLITLVVGCFVYKRNKKNQVMSPDDLAKMAGAQSMMILPRVSDNNPGYYPQKSSPRAQQQNRIAPSVRMTSMASQAQHQPDMFKPTVPLIAAFDFVGERSDELSVTVGTRMFGIEQQDGWWLAKTENGVVGLIPVSYTEMANEVPTMSANPKGAYVNPDF
ncbi:hypothetical protein BASA81_001780 [Batrachochytrium salamandrivorans]|nr:hypothetical protein BASA81_001780 [Batrachochytrium salamandrivorans]